MEQIFSAEGPLARAIPAYRTRTQQLDILLEDLALAHIARWPFALHEQL